MVIGIIGCGELGSRIGKRLIQFGYEVYGFDISEEALEGAEEVGIQILVSPKEVAEKCDFIITCVTDQHAIEECILNEEGLIHGLQSGTTIIEMTTSLPSITRKVGKEIHQKGADIIDAPVSRGIPAAESGTLSILVGGSKSTLEKSRFLLKKLGTNIIHCGALGTGHAIKAINMMMMACNLLATTEVLTVGKRTGLNLEDMLVAINSSSGKNYLTTFHFPNYIVSGTYQSNFSFGLMKKDLDIAIEMTKDAKVTSLLGSRAANLYRLLSMVIKERDDNMEVVKKIGVLMGNRRKLYDLGDKEQIQSLNSLLTATNLLTTMEGLLMAANEGIELHTFIKAINNSSGQNYITNVYLENTSKEQKLSFDDLTIEEVFERVDEALDITRTLALPMMFTNVIQEAFAIAMCSGMGKEHSTTMIKCLGNLSGYEEKTIELLLESNKSRS